jgi:tetratricopeptide (TPR) repeat protein
LYQVSRRLNTNGRNYALFFNQKLPICFELAVKEALKNDNEQKGFKAFQIWILSDMHDLLIKNSEVQARILTEIEILKNGQVGLSNPALKTFSEDTAQLKQLLEQNHSEVIRLLKKIIRLLMRRSQPVNVPHFLNNLPPMGVDCIGREDELKDLEEKLSKAQRVVLLNGLGGIGKTTVTKRYVYLHQHKYRHLIWLELKGLDSLDPMQLPLRDAFIFDPVLIKNLSLERKTDLDEFFMMLMNTLRNLPGTNLLVIDNAGSDLRQRALRDQLPAPPNWHVLITSRQKLPGFEPILLDKLDPSAAHQLFTKYFTSGYKADSLRNLLIAIDYHTLTIELMAKTLAYHQGSLTIDDLIEKLNSRRLSDPELRARLETEHSKEETDLYLHLMTAFDLSDLTKSELRLLRQLALLPSAPYSWQVLVEWFGLTGKDVQHQLREDLFTLDQKGWLKSTDKKLFTLHRLIQQAVYYQYPPTDSDAKRLVNYFTNLLANRNASSYAQKTPILTTALFLLNSLPKEISIENQHEILRDELAAAFKEVGEYEQARVLLEQALADYIHRYGEVHPDVATCRNKLGLVYEDLGRYEQAKLFLEQALADRILIYGEDHADVAATRNNLGFLLQWDLGYYEEAKLLLEQVLVDRIRIYGEDHADVAASRNNLGLANQALGEYELAKSLIEHALRDFIRIHGERHPDVATSRHYLGRVCRTLGQYEEAKSLFEKSLDDRISIYGEAHPDVATSRNNLGILYLDLGHYEQARILLEQSLVDRVRIYGEGHPDVATCRNNLGRVYKALGQYEQARILLEQTLTDYIRIYDETHPYVATTRVNLGTVYLDLAQLKLAKLLFKKALADYIRIYGQSHPDVATGRTNLGRVYLAEGRYEKARPLLEQSLADRIRIYGEIHPDVAMTQAYLALSYKGLIKNNHALDLINKAFDAIVQLLGHEHPKTMQIKIWQDQIKIFDA